jgi:hypothetical protein
MFISIRVELNSYYYSISFLFIILKIHKKRENGRKRKRKRREKRNRQNGKPATQKRVVWESVWENFKKNNPHFILYRILSKSPKSELPFCRFAGFFRSVVFTS